MTITNSGAQTMPQSVRVSDLRAYLNSLGWKPVPFARREELKFVAPQGSPIADATLLLPATEQLKDYVERVELVVRSLSQLEERPFDQILRDILTPTCDKVYVRLQTAEVRTGTLMLGFATQFFEAVKNLFTFAACAEHDPRPYFPRAFKEAVIFASRCRLAGTAPGSFRVIVESPLPPPASQVQQQLHAFPKERRILMSLMQGLTEARAAHDQGNVESFITMGKNRINANICDALLQMKPDADDAIVDIQAVWSQTWPLETQSKVTTVSFDGRSFETITAIGQAYRSGDESKRQRWQGKVFKLIADDPLQPDGNAALIALRIENFHRPLRIEVRLNIEDYRRAVQAHLDGKSVRVTGALEKSGKKATLLQPSDFDVVD